MSSIYLNGTNIQHIYRNGIECPIYYKGMLLTENTPPSYTYSPIAVPNLPETDYYFSGKDFTDFVSDAESLVNDDIEYSGLVLLLRHGARTSDTSTTGTLNDRGKTYSENMGRFLEFHSAIFRYRAYFYSTNYYRTKQTCAYIAKGIGLNNKPTPEDWIADHVDEFPAIYGNVITNETDWSQISNYCYEPNNRTSIINKVRQLVDNIAANDIDTDHWNVLISHDQLLAPLIAYALNFDTSAAKKITETNWVRFLSGIGIVYYPDYTFELVPVLGNDTTFS